MFTVAVPLWPEPVTWRVSIPAVAPATYTIRSPESEMGTIVPRSACESHEND